MKNGGFFILVSVTLVLLSLSSVHAATSNDFVKIETRDVNYFTHKDLVDSRYLVGSDQIFYGSKEGQITMKLYLRDKISSGDYKIGLRTRNKNITVKSIGVGRSPSPVISTRSRSYDYPTIIPLDDSIKQVNIVIEFDPNEIGVLEEFDILLYDDKGNTIVTYDPFISGFNFRQELTLDTSQLDANVTRDHTILLYVPPGNDFWTSDSCGDGTGFTISQSDELTQLDFNVESYNASDQNLWLWFLETETFDATNDTTAFFYYDGSCVDNSDGNSALSAITTAAYHLAETGGTLAADFSTNFDGTHVNTPTLDVVSQIDGGVTYAKASSERTINSTLLDDGYSSVSFSMWVRQPVDWNSSQVAAETIFRKQNTAADKDLITMQWRTDGKIRFFYIDGADIQHSIDSSKTSWAAGTWFHLIGTFDSGTNDMNFYVNGSTTDGGTLSEAMTAVAAGTFSDFAIAADLVNSNFTDSTIDEFKVFRNVTLTPDEAELLFLSESNGLITFGPEESEFQADFNFALDPAGLDPENNINSVTVTFQDDSTLGTKTAGDFNYFIDSVRFFTSTTTGNTTREFTTAGDFNISFLLRATDGNVSQRDRTVTISELVQNVDINFFRNTFTPSGADVNFGVTFDGNGIAFNYGFPGDQNQTTRNINKVFTDDGTETVCVTITNGGDVNKTVCENFLVGRVLTRIPQNAETLATLSPFNITAGDLPTQSVTGAAADTNIFFFDDSTSFNASISVDFNADFFPTARTFTFNSSFFDFQPFLVANDGTNLESTIFTINNAQGRVTISGIRIESFTDVNGVTTLVESKFSDGTGQALFHFIKGQEYRLDFFDATGTLLTSQTIEANDTQFFAFLEIVVVDPAPTPLIKIGVNWDPLLGNIVPDSDGNVTFSPILVPSNGTIVDVNVFISHIADSNIVFNQVFNVNSSVDFNLTFDLNVAGFNNNFPLNVNLQILDSTGSQVGDIFTKSYGIKGDTFATSTQRVKDALGQFGVTLLALAIVTMFIGQLTKRAIGEDTNFVVIPAIFMTGMFVFIGWIEFDVWTSGVIFAIGLALWSVKK